MSAYILIIFKIFFFLLFDVKSLKFYITNFSSGSYSQKEMKIVKKYFGKKTEVNIPVIPFVLNKSKGEYSLSKKLIYLFNAQSKIYIDNNNFKYYDYSSDQRTIDSRTNSLLIKLIKKIGFEKASGVNSSLYFVGIPTKYTDCILITNSEGCENIEFDIKNKLQSLITNCTLVEDELKSQLIELAFIEIVFCKIKNYYY